MTHPRHQSAAANASPPPHPVAQDKTRFPIPYSPSTFIIIRWFDIRRDPWTISVVTIAQVTWTRPALTANHEATHALVRQLRFLQNHEAHVTRVLVASHDATFKRWTLSIEQAISHLQLIMSINMYISEHGAAMPCPQIRAVQLQLSLPEPRPIIRKLKGKTLSPCVYANPPFTKALRFSQYDPLSRDATSFLFLIPLVLRPL